MRLGRTGVAFSTCTRQHPVMERVRMEQLITFFFLFQCCSANHGCTRLKLLTMPWDIILRLVFNFHRSHALPKLMLTRHAAYERSTTLSVPSTLCLPFVNWHNAQTAAACVPPLFGWICVWAMKTNGMIHQSWCMCVFLAECVVSLRFVFSLCLALRV